MIREMTCSSTGGVRRSNQGLGKLCVQLVAYGGMQEQGGVGRDEGVVGIREEVLEAKEGVSFGFIDMMRMVMEDSSDIKL